DSAIGFNGGCPRIVRENLHQRAHPRINRLDARQMRLNNLGRRNLPARDAPGQITRRLSPKVLHGQFPLYRDTLLQPSPASAVELSWKTGIQVLIVGETRIDEKIEFGIGKTSSTHKTARQSDLKLPLARFH